MEVKESDIEVTGPFDDKIGLFLRRQMVKRINEDPKLQAKLQHAVDELVTHLINEEINQA